jgi:ABC-2 type transport system ATP-binding protein
MRFGGEGTCLIGDVLTPSVAHSDRTTSIEIEGLTKRFGNIVAVDNLSFTVRTGTVTGFLGPNGAGKSTTLRMLLGLVTPTHGTATIGGRRYRDLDAPVHHVGAVLDSAGVYPGRRARDHLRVLCVAAGLPIGRVDDVLEQVGLTDSGNRRVKGFSLGMRQRLGLAAALLGDPDVLILDEPANGLDPEGVHWLRRFLRSYADEGRTVLVSSHLLAEIAQTVDDVVIIVAGRLVRQSSLTELASEATPRVWIRTPHAATLRDTLAAKRVVAELASADTVVALHTTPEHVGQLAASAGIVIYEMTTQHFDLEQYFLALTTPKGAIQ